MIGSVTGLAGTITWAVDIIGAPSALLLALLARPASTSVMHPGGSSRP